MPPRGGSSGDSRAGGATGRAAALAVVVLVAAGLGGCSAIRSVMNGFAPGSGPGEREGAWSAEAGPPTTARATPPAMRAEPARDMREVAPTLSRLVERAAERRRAEGPAPVRAPAPVLISASRAALPVPPVPPVVAPAVWPAAVARVDASSDRLALALGDDRVGDGQLGRLRGGVNLNGIQMKFAFQQATYVDHTLVSSVIVPTLNIMGGTGSTVVATVDQAGSATAVPTNTTTLATAGGGQIQLTNGTLGLGTVTSTASPISAMNGTLPATTITASGATSVLSSIGANGVTTLVSNTANGRLVQQTTKIDIALSGIHTLQAQGLPSPLLNSLMASRVLPR